MIEKREILDAARRFSLNPHVIEKDYVLGWLLAGIFSSDELAESWVFKGGTCLKKCHVETYRFSEDLDFTLKSPSHIDKEFLSSAFARIYKWISDNSGPDFFPDSERFDIYENPRARRTRSAARPLRRSQPVQERAHTSSSLPAPRNSPAEMRVQRVGHTQRGGFRRAQNGF